MTRYERHLARCIEADAAAAHAALDRGDLLTAKACLASIARYARELGTEPTPHEETTHG